MTRDSDVTIRPATLADFIHWHGGPPVRTVRGWVAELDGKPAAFAGFSLHPGFVECFSNFDAALDLPPRFILRHAERLLAEVTKYRLPLHAVADPDLPTSGKFLRRLGFTLIEASPTGDIYQCTSYL
jgi:hypothetical protein